MRRHLLLTAIVGAVALLPATTALADDRSGRTHFPEVISLPDGWLPEGIARGPGTTMYSGSRASGDVVAVNVRTGKQELVVDAPAGRVAVGLELDHRGRLWVAGGSTGHAYVYRPGGAIGANTIIDLPLTSSPSFINDVVVTRDAAWFTDSPSQALFKVPIDRRGVIGAPEAVTLTGDFVAGPGFNLNGIEAVGRGRWLIAVQSNTGLLFRIDPDTGATTKIDLAGATMTSGDGLLLRGRRLYVVRNVLNQVAELRLSRDFTRGVVVDTLTSPNFDVPTTVASLGKRLYLVNARFTTPPTPSTSYTMVAIERR